MRIRTFAASSAILMVAGVLAPAVAQASSATTLYVNNGSGAHCSDPAKLGTAAVPFCTIQAAVNVAVAGQRVEIEPGDGYPTETDITRSGTAGAPITIAGDQSELGVFVGGSGSAHAFTLTGADNIVLENLNIATTPGDAILVADSSAVTITHVFVQVEGGGGPPDGPGAPIDVTDGSTHVTISRDAVNDSIGPGIEIQPGTSSTGGSGDVVTTDQVIDSDGPGISVNSASGVDVTSNTVYGACRTGIALTGNSTGASIENNIVEDTAPAASATRCAASTGTAAGLEVDSSAVSGTTENYNVVYPGSYTATPYLWSGKPYSTAAALTAATTQGSADFNSEALAPVGPAWLGWPAPSTTSPAINSADSAAPGELSTDIGGEARVNDPQVPDTGVGPYSYYDRGAVQLQDQISFVPGQIWSITAFGYAISDQAATGAPITFTSEATDTWGEPLTYTFDFGDGSATTSNTTGSATHTFATASTFNVSVDITSPGGGMTGTGESMIISSASPNPVLTATPSGSLGVTVNEDASTDPWYIPAYMVDFGDGYSTGSVSSASSSSHTYAKPGTYKITLTLQDEGETNATTTIEYTTGGSEFTPYGPTRILDTRNGTGIGGTAAKVKAGAVVALQVAGTGSIPAGVTAVALNLTATDTTGSGFVSAYADGGSTPNVSNLNYTAGKTVPNAVIVPVGTDGKIDLLNGGEFAGPIDLLADVTGYFTQTAASGYTALSPDRLLDTRNGTGAPTAKVGAGKSLTLTIAGADSGDLPGSGITAVALNVTVTNTSGAGFVTAHPDGQALPNASNLNYVAGQTVANTVIVPVGQDGKIDLFNGGATAGPIDLIADVTGYYSAGTAGQYYPVTPTRLLDTRQTSALGKDASVAVDPASLDSSVPSAATGFVFNTTVTGPTGSGFIIAYPAGETVPNVSNVNYTPGLTVANLAQVAPGTGGAVDFYNGGAAAGSTQLIVDVFGYYLAN